MNRTISSHRTRALVALALAGGVSACAPLGKEPAKISVSSVPAGADVFVMGEKTGVTPLAIDLSAIFPAAYAPEKQPLYGVVELRKSGCKSSPNNVTTTAIAKGLNVTLECEGSVAAGTAPAKSAVTTEASQKNADVESRLRKVRELREKGLISEQEERDARQRILHEL